MQSTSGLKHIEYCDYNFMFSWKHEDNFACSNMVRPDTIRLN